MLNAVNSGFVFTLMCMCMQREQACVAGERPLR